MAGSRELDFQSHPVAALQYVAGALIDPRATPDDHDASPDGLHGEAVTPTVLARALSASLSPFCGSLDDWKKAIRRVERLDKAGSDTAAAVAAVDVARAGLENHAGSLAQVLGVAHSRIRACGSLLAGDKFQIHLGVPAPLGINDITQAAGRWHAALTAGGAYASPQDPELAHMLARADALADEALASLKEIAKQAKWLWTNEPTGKRVTSLLLWLFDLRCECLEMPPVMACLQTPLEIWGRSAKQAAQQTSAEPVKEAVSAHPEQPDVPSAQTAPAESAG